MIDALDDHPDAHRGLRFVTPAAHHGCHVRRVQGEGMMEVDHGVPVPARMRGPDTGAAREALTSGPLPMAPASRCRRRARSPSDADEAPRPGLRPARLRRTWAPS